MSTTFVFTRLTIREAQRRKILWVALIMGIGFLMLFGVGFHYIMAEIEEFMTAEEEALIIVGVLLTAGLYAVDLLVILMAVLVSVAAVSGEIESHTIDVLATKPINRWEIILGKWIGFSILITLYILFLAGGLMLIVYLRAGFAMENIVAGLGLIVLQGMLILSLTILGGTRLSTLANGVVAFMLFGVAFLGGWIEQIGALFQNETAVNIGIITSLIMPTDILWKRAITLFQPQFTNSSFLAGPFAVTSQPSGLMMWYAAGYTAVFLLLALYNFSRRDL